MPSFFPSSLLSPLGSCRSLCKRRKHVRNGRVSFLLSLVLAVAWVSFVDIFVTAMYRFFLVVLAHEFC